MIQVSSVHYGAVHVADGLRMIDPPNSFVVFLLCFVSFRSSVCWIGITPDHSPFEARSALKSFPHSTITRVENSQDRSI